MPETLPGKAKDWLDGKAFVTLVTLFPSGGPHASVVWVHRDGDDLLFSTVEGRVKHRNLEHDPRVSALVISPDDPYQYLEVRGSVTMTREGGRELIDDLMEKYQGTRPYPGDAEGDVRVVIRLSPEKVVFNG